MLGLKDQSKQVKLIALAVCITFYIATWIILRDVVLSIPAIIGGKSVISGDELVPFFNHKTQLLDQAKGEFNELTHGYEFRVRYSFLTTWMRHYLILPFAILLVIPGIFCGAYLSTAWFINKVFTNLSSKSIYLTAGFPTALIYMIILYAKITHFYTLFIGLFMMMLSIYYLLYGLLFATKWCKYIIGACLLTLFNPAVHYLILFTLFFAITSATLVFGELLKWVRKGGRPKNLIKIPAVTNKIIRSKHKFKLSKYVINKYSSKTIKRVIFSSLALLLVTLIPYALFVKFIALDGVDNLSETIPGDYYFIKDASVSWLHILSWDLAGIMDKILFGDYLAKIPRVPNIIYSLLMFIPLIIPGIRRKLTKKRSHRQLFWVIYTLLGFSFWATIGYAEPSWFPTFHRTLSGVTMLVYSTETIFGEFSLIISSTIVQVLRFPHRFQLIIFALAPMIMTLTLTLAADNLYSKTKQKYTDKSKSKFFRSPLLTRLAVTILTGLIFFIPFWSNSPYRKVYGSGNFGHFLTPVELRDLKSLKTQLDQIPTGKTIVMPPAESGKLVTDINGIDHKYIDKFYMYYLDKPSFYYGLTGDAQNKFNFFLILRGIYYQQDWWINPLRDIGVKYIAYNKNLRNNYGIGAEYLPDVESFTQAAIERQSKYIKKLYENESFILYEVKDQPPDNREKLLIDSSWKEYLNLVYNRLDLSQCYDFEYITYYEPNKNDQVVNLYTQDSKLAELDLHSLKTNNFAAPSTKTFAFNKDIISSSYYLSPMFRSFLFFSNTKWNRTEIITPGLFGTLHGNFIGVPRATSFTIPIDFEKAGKHDLYMRGAVTSNQLKVTLDGKEVNNLNLKSEPENVQYFHKDTVYDRDRSPENIENLSLEQLENRLNSDLVAVNSNYDYNKIASIDISKPGTHEIRIEKTDDNPLLVEGIVSVNEEEKNSLEIPNNIQIKTEPSELKCSKTYDVFDVNDSDYIDPGKNAKHLDLSNEQLFSMAASGLKDFGSSVTEYANNTYVVIGFIFLGFVGLIKTVKQRINRKKTKIQKQNDSKT